VRYQRQIQIGALPEKVWAERPGLSLAEQLEASIDEANERKYSAREKRDMSEKLILRTNEWAEVAFKWPDGKNLEGQFGPSVMFTTVEGKVLFLPPFAADKIRALGLRPGERINLRKAEVNGANGTKPHVEWQVERVDPPAGEQQNGTLIVRKEAPTSPETGAPPRMAAREVPQPPNLKIPYDVAFREIVTFVASGLKDSGEQWSDQARQAMVCTIFIQASKDGLLTAWERAK